MCLCISGNFYFYRSSQADCLTFALTYYHTFIVSLITKFEGVVEGMQNAEESFAAYNWDGRAVKSHCSSTLHFIYYARIRMTIVRVMMSRHYHQIVYIHSILAYSTGNDLIDTKI